MTKITLSTVSELQTFPSAAANINSNSATLVTAMDNTLSRDGTSPNQMNASLDMNGYPIINIGNISYTVATLPTGALGKYAVVTDGAAALAWGATVTGGGSTKYLVWYNGSAWTVIGK